MAQSSLALTKSQLLRRPPVEVLRGMSKLIRDAIVTEISVSALCVPAAQSHGLMKELGPLMLTWPRVRNNIPDTNDKPPSAGGRLLLLDPEICCPEDVSKNIKVTKILSANPETRVVTQKIRLDYSYWSAPELLREIMPAERESVSAYEAIGGVAHLNLREHALPFRHVIGEILLDKNPNLKTIINKTGFVGGPYRTFPYEILATRVPAEHTTETLPTQHSENGVRFELDFAKVYFNSRLHELHAEAVDLFPFGSLIADAMCGIGPFSIPAAKNKGCVVYANDLNPDCYKWLLHNMKLNKLPEGWVVPSCEDARHFIRTSLKRLNENPNSIRKLHEAAVASLTKRSAGKSAEKSPNALKMEHHKQVLLEKKGAFSVPSLPAMLHFEHYLMNLPASSLSFLDAFHGIYSEFGEHREYLRERLPQVHVYFFSRNAEDPEGDARKRIDGILGTCVSKLSARVKRQVSTNKLMLAVTFELPEEVAFGETQLDTEKLALEAGDGDDQCDTTELGNNVKSSLLSPIDKEKPTADLCSRLKHKSDSLVTKSLPQKRLRESIDT